MRGAVGADGVDPLLDQILDSDLDRVAYRANLLEKACAIWERPALCVHTDRTYFIASSSQAAVSSFSAYSSGSPAAVTARATASVS